MVNWRSAAPRLAVGVREPDSAGGGVSLEFLSTALEYVITAKHTLHLHRHSFELAQIGGKATAGILKDVVMLAGFQELALDFVADNPGPALFHCDQQLHMDFGFMALLEYA
jgi:FtsP/CotA-like multicopper oxidase with cupredoxin domain